MAHMIDQTTGKAAMAYVGDTPWHGLGQRLRPGANIHTWQQAAGLNYEVLRATVEYTPENGTSSSQSSLRQGPLQFADRQVLYRSDTHAALSVVSKSYKVVQPSEVLHFFDDLAKIGGFELETAGALSDGKRIWGLAKVNDGAPIVGQDLVRPYLLLATSYDGQMATIAKFTAIRVVCHNTLTMAVNLSDVGSRPNHLGVSSTVRIPHNQTFHPERIREKLGVVNNIWYKWLKNTRQLAEREMNEKQAYAFLTQLLNPKIDSPKTEKEISQLMNLFNENLIGSDLTGGHNRWRMLNVITEHVDHNRGRNTDTRLKSAWFGAGEKLKNRAYEMLMNHEEFENELTE